MLAKTMLSIYARDLLRLLFSEDQAALYVEGFAVLSSNPAVKAQMSRLQDETNMRLIQLVALFKAADPRMNHDASALESAIAREVAANVDPGSLGNADDARLIAAALRLEDYIMAQYAKTLKRASDIGLTYDQAKLKSIYTATQSRRASLHSLLQQQSGIGLRDPNATALHSTVNIAAN